MIFYVPFTDNIYMVGNNCVVKYYVFLSRGHLLAPFFKGFLNYDNL